MNHIRAVTTIILTEAEVIFFLNGEDVGLKFKASLPLLLNIGAALPLYKLIDGLYRCFLEYALRMVGLVALLIILY